MDIVPLLVSLLSSLSGLPVIAKVIAEIVLVAGLLPPILSAIIGVWHGVVVLLAALSAVFPNAQKLKAIVSSLQVDEQKLNDGQGKLLPILNQLSSIPLPKK